VWVGPAPKLRAQEAKRGVERVGTLTTKFALAAHSDESQEPPAEGLWPSEWMWAEEDGARERFEDYIEHTVGNL